MYTSIQVSKIYIAEPAIDDSSAVPAGDTVGPNLLDLSTIHLKCFEQMFFILMKGFLFFFIFKLYVLLLFLLDLTLACLINIEI